MNLKHLVVMEKKEEKEKTGTGMSKDTRINLKELSMTKVGIV